MSLSSDHPAPGAQLRMGQSLLIGLEGVFKDGRIILAAMAVVLATSLAVAALVRPRFVAEAKLLVLLSPDYAARAAVGSETPSPIMLEKDAILKSEVEILTSPSLAKATIAEIGLPRLYPDIAEPGWRQRLTAALSRFAHDAAARLGLKLTAPAPVDPLELGAAAFARDLTVAPDKIGNIIAVSFRNRDPAAAAQATNDLIKAYLVRRAALFSDVQSPVVAVEVETLRKSLDEAALAYAQFKATNDISDYNLQRDILLRRQGDLARDSQLAEAEIAQEEQRAGVVRHELDQTPKDVVTYGGAQQLVRHGRPNVVDALELDRARARQSLAAAKARLDTDQAQLAAADEAIRRLEAKAFELERLDRRRNLLEQAYALAAKTLDARRFQEEANAQRAASVRVIEPASPPVDSGNLRLVILAAGALLTLFSGVLAAVLSALFRRGFITPEALERSLGLPVLAAVPTLAQAPDLAPHLARRIEADGHAKRASLAPAQR